MREEEIELARSVPVVEILDSIGIQYRMSGNIVKIICPQHVEYDPSAIVYSDHLHCFGCGFHTDGIGFVMEALNIGFKEAVEYILSLKLRDDNQ